MAYLDDMLRPIGLIRARCRVPQLYEDMAESYPESLACMRFMFKMDAMMKQEGCDTTAHMPYRARFVALKAPHNFVFEVIFQRNKIHSDGGKTQTFSAHPQEIPDFSCD